MVSSTNPQRRNNNPDDALGQEISITDACVKYNNQSAEGLVPDNGEYALGNPTGSCWACLNCEPSKMDSSSGCTMGSYGRGGGYSWFDRDKCPRDHPQGCEWNGALLYPKCADGYRAVGCCTCEPNDANKCVSGGGQYPTYKRMKYLGDKTKCCLNASSTDDNKTCDPKYRSGYRSNDCNDVFESYCNSLTRLKDDDKCKNWATVNTGVYNQKVRDYCKNNMSDSFCQTKAREIGGMDDAVNTFCATHRNDPFCACYDGLRRFDTAQSTTREEVKAILARPECYVSQCSSGLGYKYNNMRNSGSCPPANVCINDLKVINSENLKLNNVNMTCNQSIEQKIGSTGNTSSGNTPITNTPITNTPNTTNNYDNTESIIEGIDDTILFIFLAILVFVIFGIILMKNKKTGKISIAKKT